MFINFTNHPSSGWSEEQTAAAKAYGEIFDLPFPDVDPLSDERYIEALAGHYAAEIMSYKPEAVLCQGEMTLAFAAASILMNKYSMIVLAACSDRVVAEERNANGDTVKRAYFKFKRFRKYSENLFT